MHALGDFVSHFWWLILIVAAILTARGIVWLIRERRLARSGISGIDRMDGITFERRLAHLFTSRSYRVEQTRARGDYGADLVLEKNGARTVVQAKRWKKNVGVKAVQEAVAAKPMYRCDYSMASRTATSPSRQGASPRRTASDSGIATTSSERSSPTLTRDCLLRHPQP